MSIYVGQPQDRDTVNYGIFNDDEILLAYCEYHDELATIAKGFVIVTLNQEQLAEELEKAERYYGVK